MSAAVDTVPNPAPAVARAYRLEARGATYGGEVEDQTWWPAVAGGESPGADAAASSFLTIGEAMRALDALPTKPREVRLVAPSGAVLFVMERR
jgi:hypothetical protein